MTLKFKPVLHDSSRPKHPVYLSYWLKTMINRRWIEFDVRRYFTYLECENVHIIPPFARAKYFQDKLTPEIEARIISDSEKDETQEEIDSYYHASSDFVLGAHKELLEIIAHLYKHREPVSAENKPIREAIKKITTYLR